MGSAPGGNSVRFILKIAKSQVRSAPLWSPSQAAANAAPANGFPAVAASATPAPFGTATPSATPVPVSALVASVKLAIMPFGGHMAQTTVLNLSTTPCPVSSGLLQCTAGQALQPGSYTVAVTAYGSANAGGTALGPTQTLPFTVAGTHASVVSMAIGVLPAAVAAAPAGYGVRGSFANGFTLYGAAQQTFLASAQDQYGDAIVGPDSPTFTAVAGAGASGSGSWQIGQPSSAVPNGIPIVPPAASISNATIAVTAQYQDQTCAQPSAVCTGSFSVTNDLQMLFVANCTASCNGKSSSGVPGSVTVYAPPYTNPPATTILNGVVQPIALLTDASMNLYVANAFGGAKNRGSVTIYAPPYTGTPVSIASGVDNPGALALDPSGNLWVANQGGNGLSGSIAEYVSPFGGAPARVLTNFAGVPTALAFDAQADLFVANGSALFEYAPPYNGSPFTVASGLAVANGFTFDPAGDLFYVDSNGAVEVYEPPYNAPPIQLPRISGTLGLLASYPAGGLLFVPDGSGNIQEFVAPFTGPPQAIAANNPSAKGIAVDGAGNVFVAYCGSGCGNNGSDSVTIFAPPYNGTPSTMTSGISAPSAITLSK